MNKHIYVYKYLQKITDELALVPALKDGSLAEEGRKMPVRGRAPL
jgi:hypothetical protein